MSILKTFNRIPSIQEPVAWDLKTILLISVSYSIITCLYFYPTFSSFSTALIGPPEDNMIFYWFLWYGSDAIINPSRAFMHNSMMYAPEGVNMFFANYYYVGVGITLLLKPFLSIVQIYNLLVLSTFVLSGLAAWFLCMHFNRNPIASFIGGFVFAFNPSHFARSLHHVHLATIQFIPLLMLFSFLSLKRHQYRYEILAGLCLVFSALCDWNYFLYGFIWMGFLGCWVLIRRDPNLKKDLFALLRISLGSILCLSPLLFPMVWIGLNNKTPGLNLPGFDVYVADLFGFVIPHSLHLLGKIDPILNLSRLMTGNGWEKAVYLGWTNLVVMGLALPFLWRNSRFVLISLLGMMILAMGVSVHVLGESLPIPLPYAIFEHLPLFNMARNPSRIMIFAYALLAILVSLSIQKLFFDVKNRKKMIVFVFVGLFVFLDYYSVAKETTPVKVPPAYEVIQRDWSENPNTFLILDIPWDRGRYFMYQVNHQIPNVQGYMGRKVGSPLIGRIPFNIKDLEMQKTLLKKNKVKYVLIHNKELSYDSTDKDDQNRYKNMVITSRFYDQIYTKVYQDKDSVTYQVYD